MLDDSVLYWTNWTCKGTGGTDRHQQHNSNSDEDLMRSTQRPPVRRSQTSSSVMDSGGDKQPDTKRKLADNTSDSSSQNSSLQQGPLKKPRIELHRVDSPKDITTQPFKEGYKRSLKEASPSSKDDGDMPPLMDEKFKTSPFTGSLGKLKQLNTTQTISLGMEKDSGDKFFTEIKEREEKHRLNESMSLDEDNQEPITETCDEPKIPPISKGRRVRSTGKSPVSASEGLISTNGSLTLTMRVFDDTRKNYIIDQLSFQTDYERVQAFLQAHGQNLNAITAGASGYSADISSQENSDRGNRINFKSLGSTIPRESIVSIISDNPVKKPGTPSGRGRKRGASDVEPILTSTKIDLSQSNGSSKIDGLTNGDDHSSGGESPLPPGKSPRVTPAIVGSSGKSDVEVTPSQRRSRGRPPKSDSSSKKSTPSVSSSVGRPRKSVDVTAGEDGSSQTSAKSPGVTPKGRPQKSILNISASSTSSGSSTKLTVTRESVGIGSSKGKTVEFDVDVLSQSDLETLVKSATLWGSMAIGEPVFARWRDKKYYSGVITQKGLNDTWHIAFEDDMKDVASESHIIPVSIMGVGVVGVYSPDGVYAPYPAKIVGHKFSAPKKDIVDRVEQAQSVIYAIECTDLETPIWCTRRQLSIEENDAKQLRREFNPSLSVAKAADISYENIIEGTRQRRSAAAATQKIVGGAFDASSAEEGLMVGASSSTPLRKMATPSQAPIKEDDSETPSTSTSAKLTAASASTSTANSQDIPSTATDANTTNTKPTGRRPGRPRKQLFTGLEFFLTASGAGDPSCADEVVVPYDKAELKDTLEKNGGKVVDSVSKESGKNNIYLISDSHARTVKYIYCLAGGIPCVSNDWIKKCIEANQLLDWNLFGLKSGFSLERESVIERHTNKPLKGMKIYVTAESEELYNYWKPVLTAAQAILLQPGKTLQNILETLSVPPEAEVLVTDATCAANVLSAANDIPIPIVRPEWLVQTIICGEKADFFGHERYRVPAVDNADEENDPPA